MDPDSSVIDSINSNIYDNFSSAPGFFSAPASVYEPEPEPVIPCFKENTKILCYVNGVEVYVNVQDIRNGTLVKTLYKGYIPVEMIGKKNIQNPDDSVRKPNRIYKCAKSQYPELTEDLFITGHHSILVDELTDKQRKEINEFYQKIYITEDKYRLPCFIDEKTEVVEKNEEVTIYHIALANKNYYWNYGIYANGLLVETCSLRYLKELSDMELVK
jgi:hypothetical protein